MTVASVLRHWAPGLTHMGGRKVNEPWRLPAGRRDALNYPTTIIDLADGLARFKRAPNCG
ncbi:hypothetical protein [Streptomyces sp. NPDC002913]